MLRLRVFPARRGDCLLLEYGDPNSPRRVLVDCGFKDTYDRIRPRLAALAGSREFRVLIVTHVDLDHVNGVLRLFQDDDCPVSFSDVWFNAFEHLQGQRVVAPFEPFGGAQGEELSLQLRQQQQRWNRAFDGQAVAVENPAQPIDADIKTTILSPTTDQLTALMPKWIEECTKAGIRAGIDAQEPQTDIGFEAFGTPDVEALAATEFRPEDSKSNGSTIALLVEHDDKRVLLTGDADARQLARAVAPLSAADGGRLRLDAMQIPHHGSRGNLSRELLALLDCRRYVVSTDGSSHGHPHDETIARILKFGGPQKEIAFNYRTRAAKWQNTKLQQKFGYTVRAPVDGNDGEITIDV